jgi:hypothetical protein
MKTSNLVILILSLLITSGGFAGINYLFTKAAGGNTCVPVALTLRA